MVGEPLASVLRSGRELFNAKFVQARRHYPNLDAQAFSTFVVSTLDPLSRQLSITPEALSGFLQSAYDVALELAGERVINSDTKAPSLWSRAWLEILPRLAAPVLGSGETILSAVSNALHHLTRAEGARPEEWIRDAAAIAPECQTELEFLQTGQLLAWRAGLAQYRRGALALATQLREPLVRAALRIPNGIATQAVLERLRRDVWYDPAAHGGEGGASTPRAMRRVGAFRGFGGAFLVPPTVTASEDELFVSSGDDAWLLTADVFGQALHRASAEELKAAQSRTTSGAAQKIQISAGRVVTVQGTTSIEMPGTITSVAVLRHTLAITSSSTHAVQLIAR